MKTSDMIAVLQAYERGEKIECKGKMEDWRECPEPLWSFDTNDYRIAPKKLSLVERIREGLKAHHLLDIDDVKAAADRIENLESNIKEHLGVFTTDELLAEIKRRMK